MKPRDSFDPEITVVIPSWNRAALLALAIQSVRNQTWTDWRLVVVDDGSTEDTRTVVLAAAEQDPRITWVGLPHLGLIVTRNTGLACVPASSRYFMLLDNDDELHPRALERLRLELEKHPGAIAAHGLINTIDQDGKLLPDHPARASNRLRQYFDGTRLVPLGSSEPTTFTSLVTGCCITTPGTCLVRNIPATSTQPFRAGAFPSDDWDFWLRLARQAPILHVPEVVLHYRIHSDNMSGNSERMKNAARRVYRLAAWDTRRNPENFARVRTYRNHLFDERIAFGLTNLRNSWRGGDIFSSLRKIPYIGRYLHQKMLWNGWLLYCRTLGRLR